MPIIGVLGEPKKIHRCGTPVTLFRPAGTVWQCRKCETFWLLKRHELYSDSIKMWEPFEPTARQRKDLGL